MVESYSKDLMHFSAHDAPRVMTFKRAGMAVKFFGEGGNQYIVIIDDDNGWISLWVDTHTSDGHPFVHRPSIFRSPSGKLVAWVYENLTQWCLSHDKYVYDFRLEGIDKFVESLYAEMLFKSALYERARAFGHCF